MKFKWMLILTLLVAKTLSAVEGNEGHGGDGYVADFIRTARSVHQWLAENTSEVPASQFLKTLESATIESVSKALVLDGIEKDAINYPETAKIVINRMKWRELIVERDRWQLVLHEVLSLMHHNDDRYQVSGPIVNAAFPETNVLASQYRGTLPSCLMTFEAPNKAMQPIVVRLISAGENYDVVYQVIDRSTFTPTLSQTLVRGLTCQYSLHHAGVMRCENASKEEFSISKKTHIRLSPYGKEYDYKDPYYYFEMQIQSAAVEKLYNSNEYIALSSYHPVTTPITEDSLEEVLSGKLPVFLPKLTYPQGVRFQKLGAKALGNTLTLEFGQTSCGFSYPLEQP